MRWDYPRVYGGTDKRLNQYFRVRGLSPRVRGNHDPENRGLGWRGTIPACTGEPKELVAQEDNLGDYPRVYGGTKPSVKPRIAKPGLSPRVRGNRAKADW